MLGQILIESNCRYNQVNDVSNPQRNRKMHLSNSDKTFDILNLNPAKFQARKLVNLRSRVDARSLKLCLCMPPHSSNLCI